jgi:hypothetical protein
MLNNVGFASRRSLLFDSLENMHSSKCMEHNLQFWCKYLGDFFRRSWRLVRTTHSFVLKDNFSKPWFSSLLLLHIFYEKNYFLIFIPFIITWETEKT